MVRVIAFLNIVRAVVQGERQGVRKGQRWLNGGGSIGGKIGKVKRIETAQFYFVSLGPT